jgi:hypothetical protein
VDVLGPDYSTKVRHEIYLDHSVLDDCEVEEKDAILREGTPKS